MSACTPFPVRHNTEAVYYLTNVILVPVLFGFGLMGNAMTSLVCNRAALRRESPLYVYLCGLAVVDALALILTVPGTLQDIEILPANVTYSRLMSYASAGGHIFSHVFRHAALWLLVILGLLEVALSNQKSGGRSRGRWDRNSTARILIFATVLFCCLLNFPRFLETEVYEVQGHCFRGMSLWSWTTSAWGSHWLYQAIYPWVTAGLCYLIPCSLLFLSVLLLWHRGGWRLLPKTRVALVNAEKDSDRQYGRLKAVWVILLTTLTLELPNVLKVTLPRVMDIHPEHETIFKAFGLIANCLSLLHSSIIFILLSLFDSDFRKTLRRTLCCLSADEYYEPMACCGCSHSEARKESVQYTYAPSHDTQTSNHGNKESGSGKKHSRSGMQSVASSDNSSGSGSLLSHPSRDGSSSGRSDRTQGTHLYDSVSASRRQSDGDLWV